MWSSLAPILILVRTAGRVVDGVGWGVVDGVGVWGGWGGDEVMGLWWRFMCSSLTPILILVRTMVCVVGDVMGWVGR